MTTTDPLSLTEAKRLSSNADTLLLRATRPADLETPIGAFLRLDDGTTPAYLLESVEGGERLGRYSFLGIGPRRLLEVRDGMARPGSQELIRFARQRVGYKAPETIIVLDEMPLNPSGKVDRAALKRMAEGRSSLSVSPGSLPAQAQPPH